MPTIAYLSNEFPSPVESYVVDEIRELRRRWVHVVPSSVRRADPRNLNEDAMAFAAETFCLYPLRPGLALQALWYCVSHYRLLRDFLRRVLIEGSESPARRMRAIAHTWLGVYYALLLEGRGIDHIHVHHGYFSSWIAMVAARMLGVGYSMTLHGSDLLVHRAYLDLKLKHCRFCLTISEFNRARILQDYPSVDRSKVIVQRLGVSPPASLFREEPDAPRFPLLLSVGRLHRVKDHAFLVRACAELKQRGHRTLCLIAGEGPERGRLERLIRRLDVTDEVGLLGHVPHDQLDAHYAMADVVVLTSRSEGIPVVLMEAMAMGKVVLAPEMTGVPELVIPGITGFLYQPGSLEEFIAKVQMICQVHPGLGAMRRAARQHVMQRFHRTKNLEQFADVFLARIHRGVETHLHEDPVLQQI
ncbi:MAG TPA: glycosyltransferase family 4 protein [Terriglobales bacterium]|nr:glycosyltransferase family 4 protein [Terriglobales bacterium]